jgi:hypothetical protein
VNGTKTSILAITVGAAFLLMLPACQLSSGAEADSLLRRIKVVGHEGAGNIEAARAWRQLVQLGPAALPAILTAFDDADIIAANWLRTAVDAIAERTLAAGQHLPKKALEKFMAERQHNGEARRLAYEWLVRIDPTAPTRLLPGMLHDPSLELRRDAVERVLQSARQLLNKGDKPGATAAFQKALSGARDRDQIDQIAKELKGLGVDVDLAAHFGFVRRWMLIGPFDSSGGVGFQKVFPPENSIDLMAGYTGKGGKTVHWIAHATTDPYGVVNLNKALGKQMGAAAYAFAALISPTERPVQVRAGSQNAIKIFLNGRLVFSREEYHHGMQMDQHIAAGKLRAGRNELLIKICQNEQTDDWAQNWSFQVRVCDESGGAVPFTLSTEEKVVP